MTNKRRTKRFLAVLLTVALLMTPRAFPNARASEADDLTAQQAAMEQEKQDLERKQQELKDQQEELDKKLREVRDVKDKKLEYKDTLAQQIAVRQEQILLNTKRIEQLDQDISEKSEQIAGKQSEIDQSFETLKRRIRAIYMAGESSTLDLILGAEDVNDFFDKSAALQRITEHDQQMIDQLVQAVESIQAEKTDIENSRAQVAQAKKDLDSQKAQLKDLQDENDRLLAELGEQEQQYNTQRAEVMKQQEAQEEEVGRLLRELAENQKKQQDLMNSSSAAPPPSSDPTPSTPDDPSPEPPDNSSGTSPEPENPSSNPTPDPVPSSGFAWPLPGHNVITDHFGWREEFGSYHRGIDIAGYGDMTGETIVSVADGTVVTAVPYDGDGTGWGIHVMILHDDGIATQYAHCSKLLVQQGDRVTQRQPIALCGNTGNSYGAHLHFEVWLDGVRVDPAPYLGV